MKHYVKLVGLAIIAASLGACSVTEIRDQAAETVRYTVEEGRDYVTEVDSLREWIRFQCREILQTEVRELLEEGDLNGARERLAANYPGLVLPEVLDALDNETLSGLFDKPFGCS